MHQNASSTSSKQRAHYKFFVVVTRSLPRNGGMAEDHGSLEAGKLPRAWTTGCNETECRQRASGAKRSKLDSAE